LRRVRRSKDGWRSNAWLDQLKINGEATRINIRIANLMFKLSLILAFLIAQANLATTKTSKAYQDRESKKRVKKQIKLIALITFCD
jgi:hypothetical protein